MSTQPLRVLLAASELYPLVKTGGLADFVHGLARALRRLKVDVVIALPAYREVLQALPRCTKLLEVPAGQDFGRPTRVLRATLPGTRQRLWLVDTPALFDRDGSPYSDASGQDWPDNAERFAHFSRIIADLAGGRQDAGWQPDVVHCNDWQTGLVPPLLKAAGAAPASVFSIHNLAYQGNFPAQTLWELGLPDHWWSWENLEFYGQLSFIKGGLVYADRVTTVSPTYALEIRGEECGHGLEGVLQHRGETLRGILNGVDYEIWNPAKDPLIEKRYRRHELYLKAANRTAFLRKHRLREQERRPLFGFIGRLAWQKGIDILLEGMEHTLEAGASWAVLGSGDAQYEQQLQALAKRHPDQISLTIGYDETLAHRIEASCDALVMPSRYEPCGLNQLYSLKYGTIPIVSDTGGLSDTVVHADDETLAAGTATGLHFAPDDPAALTRALDRATQLFSDLTVWQQLQKAAMRADFSWQRSAADYIALYREIAHPDNADTEAAADSV